eukprot:scaffold1927_cov333-Pavlova_lutheri.AAC.15
MDGWKMHDAMRIERARTWSCRMNHGQRKDGRTEAPRVRFRSHSFERCFSAWLPHPTHENLPRASVGVSTGPSRPIPRESRVERARNASTPCVAWTFHLSPRGRVPSHPMGCAPRIKVDARNPTARRVPTRPTQVWVFLSIGSFLGGRLERRCPWIHRHWWTPCRSFLRSSPWERIFSTFVGGRPQRTVTRNDPVEEGPSQGSKNTQYPPFRGTEGAPRVPKGGIRGFLRPGWAPSCLRTS